MTGSCKPRGPSARPSSARHACLLTCGWTKWAGLVCVAPSIWSRVLTQVGVRAACVSHMHSKYVVLGCVWVHYSTCVCVCVYVCVCVCVWRRRRGAAFSHEWCCQWASVKPASDRRSRSLAETEREREREGKGRMGKEREREKERERGGGGSAGTERREGLGAASLISVLQELHGRSRKPPRYHRPALLRPPISVITHDTLWW